MKAYRDDVRRHAVAAGRNPGRYQGALPGLSDPWAKPMTKPTPRHKRLVNSPGFVEAALAAVGTVTDIDFSGFDLGRSAAASDHEWGARLARLNLPQWGSGKTLRQLAQERFDAGIPLIGSPDTVAERMGEAMEAIGGDGFLISTPFQRISRRFITEGLRRPCTGIATPVASPGRDLHQKPAA